MHLHIQSREQAEAPVRTQIVWYSKITHHLRMNFIQGGDEPSFIDSFFLILKYYFLPVFYYPYSAGFKVDFLCCFNSAAQHDIECGA